MIKKTSISLFSLVILFSMILLGSLSLVSAAANGSLNPTEDVYIDRNAPTTVFDDGLLLVEQELPIGSSVERPNRLTYIKFDLSTEVEEITTAIFTVAPVTGTCVGAWNSLITLDVYGVSIDGWTEGALTWDSADTAGMMDSANLTSLGTATFDNASGLWQLIHPDLVDWVEAERVSDSTITIMVQMSEGFAPETAFFEDVETTASNASCTVPASGQPLMDLSSAPSSVTLSNAESIANNFNWVFWLVLMMGLLFMVGLTAVFQQRKPKPVLIQPED